MEGTVDRERGEIMRSAKKHHGKLQGTGKIQKCKTEFEKRTVSTKTMDADFHFWVTMWLFTLNPGMHPTSITVRHSFTTTTNFESTTPSETAVLSKQVQQRKTLFTLLFGSQSALCVFVCAFVHVSVYVG